MDRRRPLRLLGLCLVVVVAGCGQDPGPAAEGPLAAGSPTGPAPGQATDVDVGATPGPGAPAQPQPAQDPFAIPDDADHIDEAYLLPVLAALFRAETEFRRHELRVRSFDDEWHVWVAALYDPSEHPVQRQFLADTSPEQWAAFLPPDGVRELTVRRVTQVITAARDCVFVEVEYLRRGLYADGPEWAPAVVTIVPHDGQVDPARNPTPWWLVRWYTPDLGVQPDNFCDYPEVRRTPPGG